MSEHNPNPASTWIARLERVRNGLLLGVLAGGPALAGAYYRWLWPLLVMLIIAAGLAQVGIWWMRGDGVRPDRVVLIGGAALLVVLFQLIPLPRPVIALLSPQRAAGLNQAEQIVGNSDEAVAWRTLSEAPGRTADFLLLGVSYLVLLALGRRIGRSPDACRRWFAAIAIIGAGLAAYSTLRWLPTGGRLEGTLANANRAAGYFMMALPLAVALHQTADRQHRPYARLWWGIPVIILQLALLLTMSRWGIASAFLAAMIAAFLFTERRRPSVVAVGVVLLSITLINISLLMKPLWGRYSLLFNDPTLSSEHRAMAWRASLGLIGDYPLLGSGAGSFQYVFMKYQPETLQGWFRQAHNDYLNLLCDIGLMGAVLVLAAVALAVRRILAARRTRRMNRRWVLGAGLAAVLGLLLHALADFNFQIPALAMQWSFILGLTMGLSQSEPSAEGDEEPAEAPATPVWQRTTVLVGASALALLTILPLWRRQAAGLERLALGMDNWQPDTPTRHSADEWRHGVAGLTRVHQLDPTHAESTLALAHYRLLLGDLAAKRAERNPQADGERAQAHRQRAHELLLEHVARVTCDGRSWNWLGYLYGLDERFDTAAAAFARASAVWPSNEVLNERIARRMLKRRDARPIRHERLVLAEQALARLVRAKPNRIEDALAWLFDAGGDLDLLAELAAEAPDGRVRLGELLLARGRLVEAADILHPLTAGRPIPAPGPWRQYAEVMLRTGRFSMARAAALNHVLLSNALQVERSGEEVRQLFHARGLRDQAFEVLLNAARELPPPQRVQLLMPLVRAAHAAKRTEEARAVVQDLLDAPLATHDLPRLAGAAERLHDWRSAVTVLSRYAERRPGFDIFMRVGRAYERMRKDRVARIWYQRARQMDPDDAGADAALARVLVRLGEPDEALAILRQTIVRRPQHRGCYLQLARLYEKRQDVEAARRALQTGIEITDDARLHEQLKRLSAENDENGSH